ncbi:hypothetical protein RchiOBHm_Chr5g0013231 [Rosa chinensis]|uniref:Late embryogenesis abundant protein, LEA-14 n=1 Tax=Rosa chinensis TaxID=74649 RepID=A0A2P6Q5B3_ROSCH|nr:hypothetical protein RchiOBHm_Chr5g0013231 [Rosa chinensis]
MCPKGKIMLCIILYLLLIGAVAVTLVKILLFNPPNLKVTVTNASLAQFNLRNNNDTLFYNIALTITTRNLNHPANKDVLYSRIEAIAKYRTESFAKWTLSSPPFKQHRKSTTILQYPAIQGQQPVRFSKSELSQFNRESVIGVYSIEVVVLMQIKGNTKSYNCEWICTLKIRMGSIQTPFEATQCFRTKY